MQKLIATVLIAACLTTPAIARDHLSSVKTNLERELPNYGFADVDLNSLSSTQIMHINHLLYSNKSVSQIRGNIGAILGDSLIKTLFK